MTETCVLIRCSQPIIDGMPCVRLPSGGKIHMECVFSWRREGGALRPIPKKEE